MKHIGVDTLMKYNFQQWIDLREGFEEDENLARQCWEAADALGKAVQLVDDMGRQGHPAIEAEGEAADKIVIIGGVKP